VSLLTARDRGEVTGARSTEPRSSGAGLGLDRRGGGSCYRPVRLTGAGWPRPGRWPSRRARRVASLCGRWPRAAGPSGSRRCPTARPRCRPARFSSHLCPRATSLQVESRTSSSCWRRRCPARSARSPLLGIPLGLGSRWAARPPGVVPGPESLLLGSRGARVSRVRGRSSVSSGRSRTSRIGSRMLHGPQDQLRLT
jgi:hypothetical protein